MNNEYRLARQSFRVSQRRNDTRRGTMIMLSAFSLSMLSIIAAMCLNAAYVELSKCELRLATDAASKAASITLGITGDEAVARARGIAVCAQHQVAGQSLVLNNSDIQFGQATLQNDGSYNFNQDIRPYNAVRVLGNFSRRAGGVSQLPGLASFLGRSSFTLSQDSIATRIDHDIALVVDRSGSMAWDLSNTPYSYPGDLANRSTIQNYFLPPHSTLSRWAALKVAANTFFSVLQDNSPANYVPHVALVSYSSNFTFGLYTSTVASTDQSLTDNYTTLRNKLTAIGNQPVIGNTNIAAGLREGITALTSEAASRPNAFRSVVLLTDGVMTQGDDPVALAAVALSQNITVHTITFSQQADQSLMQAVAAAGGGNHYHAPDAAALNATFRKLAETLPAMLVH